MDGRPDLRTMSEVGYKGAGLAPRLLLVATHLLLIPSIRTTYRIRDTLPWLCIAVVSCFLSSSFYHACYSLDICIFDDALMHRHCDYVTSLMLANILLLSRSWIRSTSDIYELSLRAISRKTSPTPTKEHPPADADTVNQSLFLAVNGTMAMVWIRS